LSSTDNNAPEFQASIDRVQNLIDKLLAIGGKKTANIFHRELGAILNIMGACRHVSIDK
jgi:hypothetical protein